MGGPHPQTPTKIFGLGAMPWHTLQSLRRRRLLRRTAGGTREPGEGKVTGTMVGPGEGIWGRHSLGGLSAGVGHRGRGLGVSVGTIRGLWEGPGGLGGFVGAGGGAGCAGGVVIGGLRVSRGVEALPLPPSTQDTPCTNGGNWGPCWSPPRGRTGSRSGSTRLMAQL